MLWSSGAAEGETHRWLSCSRCGTKGHPPAAGRKGLSDLCEGQEMTSQGGVVSLGYFPDCQSRLTKGSRKTHSAEGATCMASSELMDTSGSAEGTEGGPGDFFLLAPGQQVAKIKAVLGCTM